MTKPTSIDLRPWAKANRFRWRYEESYGAEKPENRGDGRFYVEVVCRYGLIYPKGGNTLLAYCSRGVKRHVAEIQGVEHHQTDGDAEVFRFPADRLDEVAAILRPRRKRTYTQEELERKRERLVLARERKKALKESGQERPESTQSVDEGKARGEPLPGDFGGTSAL